MLTFYRKNIKTIVWVIVLSFVAWGAGTFTLSRDPNASYAGSIFGKKITNKEFLTTLRYSELLMQSEASQKTTPEKKESKNSETVQAPPLSLSDSSDQSRLDSPVKPARHLAGGPGNDKIHEVPEQLQYSETAANDQQDSTQKSSKPTDASEKEATLDSPQPTPSEAAEPTSPTETVPEPSEPASQNENVPESADEPTPYDQIRLAAWHTLILDRAARQEKIEVTDPELVSEIEKIFSSRGFFDRVQYESWVARNFRGRPRDFEEAVRKHLRTQKFRLKLLAGVPKKDQEAQFLVKWLSILREAKLEDFTERR